MTSAVAPLFAPGALLDGVDPDSAQRAVRNMTRRIIVRESATTLAAAGIPIMPLKGGLLATWVYDDPAERRVSDVDLLVPEQDFDGAIERLAAKGFQVESTLNWHERTLRSPDFPLPIDLHRALFPRGRFRLPAADLFARGREDRLLFGAPIIVSDPYDVCAHTIGHAAAAHHLKTTPFAQRDLILLFRKLSLDPARCAEHLEAAGMSRAARYVLGQGDPVLATILDHLHPDPLGDLLVRLVRSVTARCAPGSVPVRLIGHLTNSSLADALNAVVQALLRRTRGAEAWQLRG